MPVRSPFYGVSQPSSVNDKGRLQRNFYEIEALPFIETFQTTGSTTLSTVEVNVQSATASLPGNCRVVVMGGWTLVHESNAVAGGQVGTRVRLETVFPDGTTVGEVPHSVSFTDLDASSTVGTTPFYNWQYGGTRQWGISVTGPGHYTWNLLASSTAATAGTTASIGSRSLLVLVV